jgi:hypothetical protein
MINLSLVAVETNVYLSGIPLKFETPDELSFDPMTRDVVGRIDVELRIVLPNPSLQVMRKVIYNKGTTKDIGSDLIDERGNFIVQLMKTRFLVDSDSNQYFTTACANRRQALALVGHFPEPIRIRGYANPGPNQVPIFSMYQKTRIWHRENNAARSMDFRMYIAVQLALRQTINTDLAFIYAALAIRVPAYYLYEAIPMRNFSEGLDFFDWPRFREGVIAYYEDWLDSVIEEELDTEDVPDNEKEQVHFEFYQAQPNPRYDEWKGFLQDGVVRTERKPLLERWLPIAIHTLEFLTERASSFYFEYPLMYEAFGIFVGTTEMMFVEDKLSYSVLETTAKVPAKEGYVSLMAMKWKGKGKGSAYLLLPCSIPMSSDLLGITPKAPPELFPRF